MAGIPTINPPITSRILQHRHAAATDCDIIIHDCPFIIYNITINIIKTTKLMESRSDWHFIADKYKLFTNCSSISKPTLVD